MEERKSYSLQMNADWEMLKMTDRIRESPLTVTLVLMDLGKIHNGGQDHWVEDCWKQDGQAALKCQPLDKLQRGRGIWKIPIYPKTRYTDIASLLLRFTENYTVPVVLLPQANYIRLVALKRWCAAKLLGELIKNTKAQAHWNERMKQDSVFSRSSQMILRHIQHHTCKNPWIKTNPNFPKSIDILQENWPTLCKDTSVKKAKERPDTSF